MNDSVKLDLEDSINYCLMVYPDSRLKPIFTDEESFLNLLSNEWDEVYG